MMSSLISVWQPPTCVLQLRLRPQDGHTTTTMNRSIGNLADAWKRKGNSYLAKKIYRYIFIVTHGLPVALASGQFGKHLKAQRTFMSCDGRCVSVFTIYVFRGKGCRGRVFPGTNMHLKTRSPIMVSLRKGFAWNYLPHSLHGVTHRHT